MNKPRNEEKRQPAGSERQDADAATKEGPQLQPPPTGANHGSPAAPVMKQFVKTRTESSGRS